MTDDEHANLHANKDTRKNADRAAKGVLDLVGRLADEEEALERRRFLAPQVPGGRIVARVGGLVATYRAEPADHEGWGVFLVDKDRAVWLEEADFFDVQSYLERGRSVKLIAVRRLIGRTWLAFPLNRSDARQSLGRDGPVLLHLTEGLQPFETVQASFDGAAFWFVELDRGGDPALAEGLRTALEEGTPVEEVSIKDATPEHKVGYHMAGLARGLWRPARESPPSREANAGGNRRPEERRLQNALEMAGGELVAFVEHDDRFLIQWRTPEGDWHQSAIEKGDLTVISAGFCLDGGDAAFDLESLVGVARGADEGW